MDVVIEAVIENVSLTQQLLADLDEEDGDDVRRGFKYCTIWLVIRI